LLGALAVESTGKRVASAATIRGARMFRMIVLFSAFALCNAASADITNYADVKANGGVELSTAELKELMLGAKVVSRTQAGSTRSWQNKQDGTLTASSDGRGVTGGRNAYATGEGTWKVSDSGRWCVKIDWPRNADDWCRMMFKVGNKYYGVSRLEDNAPTMEFELSK
jgi:hypothetical protein